jgi:hypothetical protein
VGKARDMYLATAGLLALSDMDEASLGCIGRIMRRGVLTMAEGIGASSDVVDASICAFMMTGCAGVGCCAMTSKV